MSLRPLRLSAPTFSRQRIQGRKIGLGGRFNLGWRRAGHTRHEIIPRNHWKTSDVHRMRPAVALQPASHACETARLATYEFSQLVARKVAVAVRKL